MSRLTAGDGNGWVACHCGHKHWGRHGAAGLLLSADESVLLQLRAAWTHNGGTWALPGGARDSHESAEQAALREVAEETSLDAAELAARVHVYDEYVDDHGTWSYTTVLARADTAFDVRSTNPESDEMRWWPVAEVAALPLHFGFASSWPVLRERVDAGA